MIPVEQELQARQDITALLHCVAWPTIGGDPLPVINFAVVIGDLDGVLKALAACAVHSV